MRLDDPPNDPDHPIYGSDWLGDVTTDPSPNHPKRHRPRYQPEQDVPLDAIKAVFQTRLPPELRPPPLRRDNFQRVPSKRRQSPPDSLFLYVPDIAALLGVSTRTVREWIRANILPARKLGHTGRSAAPWRIARLDWEAFQAGTTRREILIDDVYSAFDHDNGRDDPDHIRKR